MENKSSCREEKRQAEVGGDENGMKKGEDEMHLIEKRVGESKKRKKKKGGEE